jgi:ATP-binding cassette subfamily B protein
MAADTSGAPGKTLSVFQALRLMAPLLPIFKQHRLALAAGICSLLVTDATQLVIPLVVKRAVDSLASGVADSGALLARAAEILALACVMGLFRFLWRWFLLGFSRRAECLLRARLYAHLQKMSMAFFRKNPPGDLMARATNDLNAIRMASGMGLAAATDSFVIGAAAIVFMLSIHPVLAAVALVPAPFVVLISRIYTRRMGRGFERAQTRFGLLTEAVREAFTGIRVVKAHGREEWTSRTVRDRGQDYVEENLSLARSFGVFMPVMTVFSNLGLAVVIALGGRLAILGDISPGDFVAFITYLNLLAWPMMAMGWVVNLIQRGGASMRRVSHVLNTPPDITDGPLTRTDITALSGEIETRDLTFRYPGSSGPVLDHVSFTVRPGETVSVVGQVGCGKSSLFLALSRMVNPPPGTVFLGGHDILTIPLALLRRHVGFVPQEPVVFSDTLLGNVVFGREGIREEEVWEALSLARMDAEVKDMPAGIETVVGERGLTLSGGQRQRLALARALVRPPAALILDDALSMVDTRTERAILNRLMEGKGEMTTLMATHRVSTNKRADHVAVLREGRLHEWGSHAELIAMDGHYRRLYEARKALEETEAAPGHVG